MDVPQLEAALRSVPYLATLGVRVEDARPGTVVLRLPASDAIRAHGGSLHNAAVFAVAENYPELKANENFLSLQDDLAEVEDQIQAARRYYNGTVRDLNIQVESFPSNLIANIFNFNSAEFFEIDFAEQREVPKVEF